MKELAEVKTEVLSELRTASKLLEFYDMVKVANEDPKIFANSRFVTAYDFLFEQYNKEES